MRTEALPPIVERIARNLCYPGVVEELAAALTQQAGVAACRIWIAGPGDRCRTCALAQECRDRTTCLHLAASAGCDVGAEGACARYPLNARAIGQVASTRAPFISHQPAMDHRIADAAALANAQICCCTAWPLLCDQTPIGVLAIYSREPLGDADLQQLAILARRCASSIGNALSAEHLRERLARLEQHNQLLGRELLSARHHEQILGSAPAIHELRERINLLAGRSEPVLICGPAGSGKELAARALHAHGGGRWHPFVRVDCRNTRETFLECELFGQEAGNGPCSNAARPGLLEIADQGILFLKHVDCLPGRLAQRLHEFVREGRAARLGGDASYPVRARIIASCSATPEPVTEWIQFLRQSSLAVAPLRDRRADIPLLARHNLRRFARLHGRDIPEPADAELERLQEYDWPGNVRELIHICERAVLLSDGSRLCLDAVQPQTRQTPADPEPMRLEDMERAHLVRVLRLTRGVIQGPGGAAALLGLRPSTLRSRMSRLGIARRP